MPWLEGHEIYASYIPNLELNALIYDRLLVIDWLPEGFSTIMTTTHFPILSHHLSLSAHLVHARRRHPHPSRLSRERYLILLTPAEIIK